MCCWETSSKKPAAWKWYMRASMCADSTTSHPRCAWLKKYVFTVWENFDRSYQGCDHPLLVPVAPELKTRTGGAELGVVDCGEHSTLGRPYNLKIRVVTYCILQVSVKQCRDGEAIPWLSTDWTWAGCLLSQ